MGAVRAVLRRDALLLKAGPHVAKRVIARGLALECRRPGVICGATGIVQEAVHLRRDISVRDADKRARLVDELLGLTGDPARDRYLNIGAFSQPALFTSLSARCLNSPSASSNRGLQNRRCLSASAKAGYTAV